MLAIDEGFILVLVLDVVKDLPCFTGARVVEVIYLVD